MLYKYFETVNDDDAFFEMLLNSDGIVFNNSPLSGQKTKHSLVYNMSSHLWKYCDTVDWLNTKKIC